MPSQRLTAAYCRRLTAFNGETPTRPSCENTQAVAVPVYARFASAVAGFYGALVQSYIIAIIVVIVSFHAVQAHKAGKEITIRPSL
jgi:hypothetical protein